MVDIFGTRPPVVADFRPPTPPTAGRVSPVLPVEDEDTMPYTWWLFASDPATDTIDQESGIDTLDKMVQDLQIFPFQSPDGKDTIFLARFELPQYGKGFRYSEAVFYDKGTVLGFVDFLGGIPMECIEMLIAVCESDKAESYDVQPASAGPGVAAPVPKQFFKGAPEERILLNYLYLTADYAQFLAQNLGGEPEPELHYWLRFNLPEKIEATNEPPKFPVPGQFMGMAVRMMPDEPWGLGAGQQKSSPFLFSGNWMDTVFYTGAIITEVIDPTDEIPYSTYKVKWRKNTYTVNPTDFAEYQVGDRVTILKIPDGEFKDSQLWKDDDMKNFGDKWVICPITFWEKEE